MRLRSRSPWFRPLLPALLGLLCIVPVLSAGVFVVDLGGGGDFTNINDAINASVDGDIIVITAGNYTTQDHIETGGRALVIIGDTGGTSLLPSLIAHDLPAGKTLVLRHLSFKASFFSSITQGTVLISNNLGRVHIEDCIFPGWDAVGEFGGGSAPAGTPGLRLINNAAVAVHRCTITGGKGVSTVPGPFPPGQMVVSDGGSAIEVISSSVSLHHVTAMGGHGGSGTATGVSGANAGHGLRAVSSAVIVSGSTLEGADGGAGAPTPGASGSGVHNSGAGASFSELDSLIFGGADAPDLTVLDGPHVVWTGEAWSVVLSSPVRSGGVGLITALGPPGKTFGLFYSLSMGYLPTPGSRGAFLLGSPFVGPLLIATTNGLGKFSVPFTAPSLLPFGLEGLVTFDQALMLQDAGTVLSSATAYVQLQPPN